MDHVIPNGSVTTIPVRCALGRDPCDPARARATASRLVLDGRARRTQVREGLEEEDDLESTLNWNPKLDSSTTREPDLLTCLAFRADL